MTTSRPSAERSVRSTAEALLTFDDVTLRHPNDVVAVEGFTLSIDHGERIALIGPSGAGKSTVLALASGLSVPTSGTVRVMGVDSRELGRRANRAKRARIGIVSQDIALIGSLRVASNVAAGRLGRSSWIQAVAALVRPGPVDEIGAALDAVGIVDKLWERADRLSGGQAQRVAIARALFQKPDLLLADEPVSALDPARSAAVMATIASSDERTLVASMHDAPLALQCCDRIIALRQGRIEFDLHADAVDDAMLRSLYAIDDSPRK